MISVDTLDRNLPVFDPGTEMICSCMAIPFASPTQTLQETPHVACSVFIFLIIIRANSKVISKSALTCLCFLMEVRCVLCKVGIGFPKGSIIGLVLFITYINDLYLRIHSVSQPILFADNGSVIISGRNFEDNCSVSNLVIILNGLLLICSEFRKNKVKFTTKNLSHSTLHFGYREKYIEEMVNTIFHGLQSDSHLN